MEWYMDNNVTASDTDPELLITVAAVHPKGILRTDAGVEMVLGGHLIKERVGDRFVMRIMN